MVSFTQISTRVCDQKPYKTNGIAHHIMGKKERKEALIIRCKICKTFLTIRDGVKGNSIEFAYEKNKNKLEKSTIKFSKADGFAALSTKLTPFFNQE